MSALDPRAAWDLHARTYERIGAPFTGYIAQALFHTVAGRLPPRARILEVACGNGELSRAAVLHNLQELAESGTCGTVTATDVSPAMVAIAERNLGALGASHLVRARCRTVRRSATTSASSLGAAIAASIYCLASALSAGPRHTAVARRPPGERTRATSRQPAWRSGKRKMPKDENAASKVAFLERAVLSAYEARAGGPDRPLRFDASCHFLVARRG